MAKRSETALMKRIATIHGILFQTYGPQECCLAHCTPFQLLVATILSAQCTDKKVNSITPALFEKYPDAEAFAKADVSELEDQVHVCGFYHAKARNIIGASKKIMEDFNGILPSDMESLVTLPGVGRKTANVVLGDAFQVPGLPVDTHVIRLSNRIGIVHDEDPVKIEEILCSNLPPETWSEFSHLLIIHGRTRCPARRPQCAECEIREFCDTGKKQPKG